MTFLLLERWPHKIKRCQMAASRQTKSTPALREMAAEETASDSDESGSAEVIQSSLARQETRVANALRLVVLALLIASAVVLSVGVYMYTSNQESYHFVADYEDSADKVIASFLDSVERNLNEINTMSTYITAYAMHAGQKFPNVTVPDFAIQGANLRVQSGSHVVHWMPLVSDENRADWEAYAMENRFQIDQAFELDKELRLRQDAKFEGGSIRSLEQQPQGPSTASVEENVLDDGSGYHPKIWSNGGIAPKGDEIDGSGPYLPLWQRSPVDEAKQSVLNMDFGKTRALDGALDVILRDRTAVMNRAAYPIPAMEKQLESNLQISQYRLHVDDFLDDLSTFIAYPVFDGFSDESKVVGVLATNIYWKILFSDLLPNALRGITCVVENSFNQTFSYRLDGPEASFIGEGDHHDPNYDHLELSTDVNEYLGQRAGPRSRSYTTVPLNEDVGRYRIRIYPSKTLEDEFVTQKPRVYTAVVIATFVFTALLFLLYSFVVERRQNIMMNIAIDNASKAAAAERELNEFLSHEVRNPLAAAISACSFVSVAVNEDKPLSEEQARQCVREDVEVISTSLHFINDFLRSTLDIHRASGKELQIDVAATDVLRDVFEPVSAMIYTRNAIFEILIECPENLIIMASCLRLKQVVLNLVRNASKFVNRGFIRMRAESSQGVVRIYVEDSGPGIPATMRKSGLFSKYHESLDLLSQGTGIGLCLSKKLMLAMNGDLWLDDSYESGLDGAPGACFVIETNSAPIDLESNLPVEAQPPSLLSQKESSDDTFIDLESHDGSSLPTLPDKLSILFVDDDVVLRKLFMRAVRRLNPGWNVQEAASGETALRLCEDNVFDIIFLDQFMASVDKQLLGTETARAMRTKGIRSIICGLSANDLKESFVSSGADSFILKPMPCGKEELQETLQLLLHEKAATEAHQLNVL